MCQDSHHTSALPSPCFKLPLSLASSQLSLHFCTFLLHLFSTQRWGQSLLKKTSQIMRSLCSKSCEDCPSLSELKSEPLGFQAACNLPWSPSRIRTSPLTSSSWSLLPPCLPLSIILSTLSLRGVCTPDLSVWKLCAQASAWLSLYLLPGLCSDTISHWNLPCNYINYRCPQALLSGLLCLILCFSFLHSTY